MLSKQNFFPDFKLINLAFRRKTTIGANKTIVIDSAITGIKTKSLRYRKSG